MIYQQLSDTDQQLYRADLRAMANLIRLLQEDGTKERPYIDPKYYADSLERRAKWLKKLLENEDEPQT